MPAVIKFYTDEYSEHTDQFATYDAIANLASALTEEGFTYRTDYWIISSSYNNDGRQVLASVSYTHLTLPTILLV